MDSRMILPFNLLILKVFHAQKNRVRPAMAEIGLSPGQPKLLTFLALHGKCLQKELAAACDIEPATISRLLNLLEENGLIARSDCTGDRRAVAVDLTAEGRQLYENEIRVRIGKINSAALTGFSEAERREFECYLRRMYRNLTGVPLDRPERAGK